MERDTDIGAIVAEAKVLFFAQQDNIEGENEIIAKILEQLAIAYEYATISWPCFRDLDMDVRDWGFQKTLLEIAELPEHGCKYKDYRV